MIRPTSASARHLLRSFRACFVYIASSPSFVDWWVETRCTSCACLMRPFSISSAKLFKAKASFWTGQVAHHVARSLALAVVSLPNPPFVDVSVAAEAAVSANAAACALMFGINSDALRLSAREFRMRMRSSQPLTLACSLSKLPRFDGSSSSGRCDAEDGVEVCVTDHMRRSSYRRWTRSVHMRARLHVCAFPFALFVACIMGGVGRDVVGGEVVLDKGKGREGKGRVGRVGTGAMVKQRCRALPDNVARACGSHKHGNCACAFPERGREERKRVPRRSEGLSWAGQHGGKLP